KTEKKREKKKKKKKRKILETGRSGRRDWRRRNSRGKPAAVPPSGHPWLRGRWPWNRNVQSLPRWVLRRPIGQPRWPREERNEARRKRDPNWKIDVFRPIQTPMKAILVLMESL